MRQAFVEALCERAAADPNVWLLTGDLGYGVLDPFRHRFGHRFVNVGVAEQNMAGLAAGLAMTGKRVFAYSIATFATIRCLEQWRNDVAYHNLDVTVVGVGAGFAYGAHGFTHHAIDDLPAMSLLPGFSLLTPADPIEAAELTRQARGPSYLRLGKGDEPALLSERPVEVGRPRLCRSGKDGTFLAIGSTAHACLEATHALAQEGLNVGMATLPSIRPLEVASLNGLPRPWIVAAECLPFSLGFEPDAACWASPARFVGRADQLRAACGLDGESLAEVCRQLRQKKAA